MVHRACVEDNVPLVRNQSQSVPEAIQLTQLATHEQRQTKAGPDEI